MFQQFANCSGHLNLSQLAQQQRDIYNYYTAAASAGYANCSAAKQLDSIAEPVDNKLLLLENDI